MRQLLAIILLTVGTPDLAWSANCLLDSPNTEVAANVGPYPADTEVGLVRDGTAVDTQSVADDGLFVTVADVLTPGESASYTVTVNGEAGWTFDTVGRTDCAEVQPAPDPDPAPEAAAPAPPPSELPFTGTSSALLVAAAGVMMFAGIGLVAAARNR